MRRQFITNRQGFQPPFSGGSAPRLLLPAPPRPALAALPAAEFSGVLPCSARTPCRFALPLDGSVAPSSRPPALSHPLPRPQAGSGFPTGSQLGGDTARRLRAARRLRRGPCPVLRLRADVEGRPVLRGRRCRAYSRDWALRSLRAVAHFSHDIGRLFMYNAPAPWLSHTFTFTRSTRCSTA